MNEFKHEINFETLSKDELNNIAGGLPGGFTLPAGFDIYKPQNCPRCGAETYVSVFSWGQTSNEDGHYNKDAWIARFKCRKCGHGWQWGIDINDRD